MSQLARAGSRISAILLLALSIGCASGQPKAAERPITLTVSLDKQEYLIGEPVILSATLENKTKKPLDILGFDHRTLKFLSGLEGMSARVEQEFVRSQEVLPESRELDAHSTLSRQFVFIELTKKPGKQVLVASFKGAVVGEKFIDESVFSVPVGFNVRDEVAFRRDPHNGLILKEQAIEIATKSVTGNVLEANAVLVPLGKSGLFTWVIMIRAEEAGVEKKYTIQVDPYFGRIRPIELKDAATPSAGPGSGEKGD